MRPMRRKIRGAARWIVDASGPQTLALCAVACVLLMAQLPPIDFGLPQMVVLGLVAPFLASLLTRLEIVEGLRALIVAVVSGGVFTLYCVLFVDDGAARWQECFMAGYTLGPLQTAAVGIARRAGRGMDVTVLRDLFKSASKRG